MTGKTHFKTLVDSDWLGQWDLPAAQDVVVIIESVSKYVPERRRTVEDKRTGQKKPEPLKRLDIGFRGKRKHWLAGPVSLERLAKMYGKYIEDWIGKPIALYVDPKVQFGSETTGGVRVRPTAPRGKEPTPDPLDNPVDEAKADQLERARDEVAGEPPREREPGEDDE